MENINPFSINRLLWQYEERRLVQCARRRIKFPTVRKKVAFYLVTSSWVPLVAYHSRSKSHAEWPPPGLNPTYILRVQTSLRFPSRSPNQNWAYLLAITRRIPGRPNLHEPDSISIRRRFISISPMVERWEPYAPLMEFQLAKRQGSCYCCERARNLLEMFHLVPMHKLTALN